MQHKIFCVREFIKTESATAVQRAFRLRFNIQPPTRKSICRWNHQFEQIGCLCKGKSSGRPRVSVENARRIQESFERSPRKSTRRVGRELGIPQLSGVCWGNWVHLFESPCIYKYMHLNTMGRFYIHKEVWIDDRLNDKHTIFHRIVFDTILKKTPLILPSN